MVVIQSMRWLTTGLHVSKYLFVWHELKLSIENPSYAVVNCYSTTRGIDFGMLVKYLQIDLFIDCKAINS